MRIERRYTKEGQSAYADIAFRLTASEIRNPDGSVVFKADDVEVPAFWSQVAADVLAQKYFRKAGLPARLKKVEEPTVPSWLWRSVADTEALELLPEKERSVGEHSSKQVFERLAGTWTYWGWKAGYFDAEADARAFFDELVYMLAAQMAAPNSPQWFNTGLHWAYGIDGPSQGHFYIDRWNKIIEKTGVAFRLALPHVAFHRQIGEFRDLEVSPAGLVLDAAAWQSGKDKWLPSTQDGDFIQSLMKPVTEPGRFASWIAPPRVGIDNKPGDFEYVKIAA
jgi:ribonucleoside-diphosphate reductase alpha chain